MEVVANPANVWNWVGLAGDTLDLIPFVTGLGESTRLLKTIDKVDYSKVITVGNSNKLGKMGEAFVGINQHAKKSIRINGRVRIPDALERDSLTEVKNVKYISNTKQLRDFADYAKLTNRRLKLYVRPTTRVAKTVLDAGWEINRIW